MIRSTMLTVALMLTAIAVGCDNRMKDPAKALPTGPTYLQESPGDAQAVYVVPGSRSQNATVAEPPKAGDQTAYTVDAMIGQINGRPLYASQIFEQIGEDTLVTLGQKYPRNEFGKQAGVLLGQTLSERVQNALILAEAEAGLTENEQRGLFGALQKIREDIVSSYGGVEGRAEEDLKDVGGISGRLELERQKLLVQKYRQEKVFPSISVNRREVERYYEQNYDKFNPPASLKIAFIQARTQPVADDVAGALAAGKSFEEAGKIEGARMREAEYKANLDTFNVFTPEVNQKVRQLSMGQHTDATKMRAGTMWVKLVDVERGEGKTLTNVYRQIEIQIRNNKFNQVNREHIAELMKKGNYTPVEDMIVVLLDVAMNRYAAAE